MQRTRKEKERIEEDKPEVLFELLKTDGYLAVNKVLIRILGLNTAVFLCDLMSKYSYFKEKEQLEQGWFFNTQENREWDTGLTHNQQRKSIKKLEEFEVLEQKRKGVPAKQWFKLNHDKLCFLITSYLKSNNLSFKKQELYINKNNIIRIIDPPSTKTNNSKSNYLPLAKKLSNIILTKKNIKHTNAQINAWVKPISQLVEKMGVSEERIEQALDWYFEHIGKKYTPVIESGSSLKNKFLRLEDAMHRYNKEQAIPSKSVFITSPKEIIREKFSNEAEGAWVFKQLYKPFLELMEDSDEEVQLETAEGIISLISWYEIKQQKPSKVELERMRTSKLDYEIDKAWKWIERIPSGLTLLKAYSSWLSQQFWISHKTPSLLCSTSKVFRSFLSGQQKEHGIDFFTGKTFS